MIYASSQQPLQVSYSSQKERAVGLGLRLERSAQDRTTYVQAIIPGFAAHLDGRVQVDDVIVAVDYQPVEGLRLEDVKQMTMGKEGSTCTLQMFRGEERYQVTLTRIAPAHIDVSNQEAMGQISTEFSQLVQS